MTFETATGKVIARRRQANGLSERELAERAGITAARVRLIERGRDHDLRFSTVVAIAAALGADWGEFCQACDEVRWRTSRKARRRRARMYSTLLSLRPMQERRGRRRRT